MGQQILVIGGSGRTGQLIVQKLKQAEYTVRVLTRHSQSQTLFDAEVETVEGDITQSQEVEVVLRDVSGVIIIVESAESAKSDDAPNSPKAVHYEGTRHVLTAIASRPVHIVLVTQIYITRPDRYPEMSHIIHWRSQAEQMVRASGLPYTIVRPAWLTNNSSQQEIWLEQGDRSDGEVSRAAVAEVCVQALQQPTAQGKTFEVYSQSGTLPTDWQTAFAALQSDGLEVR